MLGQNAEAAGGIPDENVGHSPYQLAVLEDGLPLMPCTIPPVFPVGRIRHLELKIPEVIGDAGNLGDADLKPLHLCAGDVA